MYTVIDAITAVKLATVQLPTTLACWRNTSLASPFSTLSMHLHMGWLVVTFCPARLFWTEFTKMIYSKGVLESNLAILILYFPEIVSPGVLWLWSFKLILFWSDKRNDWFDQFAWATFCLMGDEILHFNKCLAYFTICGELLLLCLMLKIGRNKAHLDVCRCGSVRGRGGL